VRKRYSPQLGLSQGTLPVICALFIALTGCQKDTNTKTVESTPAISITNRQDRIELVMSVRPGSVNLTQDQILEIAATYPSEIEVHLPEMDDRLEGFLSNQMIEDPLSVINGSTHIRRRYLLTPSLAAEYRIAPAAITYVDKSHTPAKNGWFPSPAITIPPPVYGTVAGENPSWQLNPRWIHPSSRTVTLWTVIILFIIALGWLAWKWSKRIRRKIRLMVMSPRERALFELQELLSSDLLARGEFKEFYLRLTRIVRQFIERRHGIRAPEQTTEEFLQAISKDTRFPVSVATRLKAFLVAADLVKFAAHTPDQTAIDDVTATARGYIESDKPESVAPRPKREKK
jgi:hypothetical protein